MRRTERQAGLSVKRSQVSQRSKKVLEVLHTGEENTKAWGESQKHWSVGTQTISTLDNTLKIVNTIASGTGIITIQDGTIWHRSGEENGNGWCRHCYHAHTQGREQEIYKTTKKTWLQKKNCDSSKGRMSALLGHTLPSQPGIWKHLPQRRKSKRQWTE